MAPHPYAPRGVRVVPDRQTKPRKPPTRINVPRFSASRYSEKKLLQVITMTCAALNPIFQDTVRQKCVEACGAANVYTKAGPLKKIARMENKMTADHRDEVKPRCAMQVRQLLLTRRREETALPKCRLLLFATRSSCWCSRAAAEPLASRFRVGIFMHLKNSRWAHHTCWGPHPTWGVRAVSQTKSN